MRRAVCHPSESSMPIRFRCAYCNQLMGIARRKSGTVVRCPNCAGQVVVPRPDGANLDEPGEAKPAHPGQPLFFEENDFDEALGAASPGQRPLPPMEEPDSPSRPIPCAADVSRRPRRLCRRRGSTRFRDQPARADRAAGHLPVAHDGDGAERGPRALARAGLHRRPVRRPLAELRRRRRNAPRGLGERRGVSPTCFQNTSG